jgi:hypothetical protein
MSCHWQLILHTKAFEGAGDLPAPFCTAMHPKEAASGRFYRSETDEGQTKDKDAACD